MKVLYNLLMIMMGINRLLVHISCFVCSPRFKRLYVIEINHFLSLSLSQAVNFVKSERVITKLLFCSRRMNIRFVMMSDNVLLGLMLLCPQGQLKSDGLASCNRKITIIAK